MHHIYHTEGIILGSRNYGETGKYYSIFTRDLGMIYAGAQGVRKISSKLRFILQDFSYVKIDLVRGKDFWRVTSASKTNKLDNIVNSNSLSTLSNVCRLLKRLLVGEEANVRLFDDFIGGLLVLEKSNDLSELRNIEIIMVLRILNSLGYLEKDKNSEGFIESPLEKELVFSISKSRREMLLKINKALRETQL